MAALLALSVKRHADDKFLGTPPSPPQSPPTYNCESAPPRNHILPNLTTTDCLSTLDQFVVGTKKRRKQARPTFNGDAASVSSAENTEDDDLVNRSRRHYQNDIDVFKYEYENHRKNNPHEVQNNDIATNDDDDDDQKHHRMSEEPIKFLTGGGDSPVENWNTGSEPVKFHIGGGSPPPVVENYCSKDSMITADDTRHRSSSIPPELLPITSAVAVTTTALTSSPPQLSFADVPVQHYGLKIVSSPVFASSSSPSRFVSSSPAALTPEVQRRGGGGGVEDPSSDGELDAEGLMLEGSGAGQAEVCPQCRKVFKRRVYLQRHMAREHWTTAKIFKCDKCTYETKHQSNLLVHRRTHTGERPYHCGACGQRYTQGHLLKAHIRSRHDADMRYYNMDKRTDGVRCRRLVVNQKHAGLLVGLAGANGINGIGKEDRIRFLLQAAENGRILGTNSVKDMLAANGASRALFGNNDSNGIFDVNNRMPQQRIENNGFLLSGSNNDNNKKELLPMSAVNKNIFGGGWGVKEDRIRFLLQAAEVAQRHPTPPHNGPTPSTSIAQSLFMKQQQNSALNQYVNALSACLPSGMPPLMWPPAMPLSLGGSGGASVSSSGNNHGGRFPTDMGPHATLLSTMSLGGGGGGEDLSTTSSMLSSMLAKLSRNSPATVRISDERKITRPDSRDSQAAAAMMMLPQDLSITGGGRGEESKMRHSGNIYSAPAEYERSLHIQSSSSPSVQSRSASSPRSILSDQDDQAADLSKPRDRATPHENWAPTPPPQQSLKNIPPSPLTSRVEGYVAEHNSRAISGERLNRGRDDSESVEMKMENVDDRFDARAGEISENRKATDVGLSNASCNTHLNSRLRDPISSDNAAEGCDYFVKKEKFSPNKLTDSFLQKSEKSSKRVPSLKMEESRCDDSCSDASCPHLDKLRALRRNVYRMLRVFTPYLGVVGGEEDCPEDGEGDAIDKFLHEVIYSKMDEGD